jgi:hypothetical protein
MLNAVEMMFINKIPTGAIVRVKVAEMFGMRKLNYFFHQELWPINSNKLHTQPENN